MIALDATGLEGSPPPSPKPKRKARAPAEAGESSKKKRRDAKKTASEAEVLEDVQKHENFGLGERAKDLEGDQLLRWDRELPQIHISTRLPSWIEDDDPDTDAYNLMFGLYGREDAEVIGEARLREVINRGCRSALRTGELLHHLARRALTTDRDARQLAEENEELKQRLEEAEASAKEPAARPDEDSEIQLAEKISKLEEDLSLARGEIDSLRLRLAQAESKLASAGEGSSSLGLQSFTPSELKEARVKIAVGTLKAVLERLRGMGATTAAGDLLRPEEVLPELFPGSAESPLTSSQDSLARSDSPTSSPSPAS